MGIKITQRGYHPAQASQPSLGPGWKQKAQLRKTEESLMERLCAEVC